jgi:hypothetical protein
MNNKQINKIIKINHHHHTDRCVCAVQEVWLACLSQHARVVTVVPRHVQTVEQCEYDGGLARARRSDDELRARAESVIGIFLFLLSSYS